MVSPVSEDRAIDYKRVPQLAGVDREAYRGKAREEVRVTIVK